MALASSLTEGTMAGDYKIVKKLAEGENFGPLKHRPHTDAISLLRVRILSLRSDVSRLICRWNGRGVFGA